MPTTAGTQIQFPVEYLEEIEETVIRRHLTANGGNVTKAAKDLQMLRQNLQHKIKKYGIR